jgi:hypothetical protein
MGGHRGDTVVRGRHRWEDRLPRITALAAGALAVLVSLELVAAASADGYAVALVGTVATCTAVAAWRMWVRCSFDVRLATGGLAGVILAGQVLVSSLGGPGGPAARWHLDGVAVAAVAVLVLLLAAAAARPVEADEHPYAL